MYRLGIDCTAIKKHTDLEVGGHMNIQTEKVRGKGGRGEKVFRLKLITEQFHNIDRLDIK